MLHQGKLPSVGFHRGLSAIRFQDFGQKVGFGIVTYELDVLGPVGVVEHDGAESVFLEQQELDFAEGDAVGERILKPLRAEQAAVDAHDLHPGARPRRSPIMPGTTSAIWPSGRKVKPSECWAEMAPRPRRPRLGAVGWAAY